MEETKESAEPIPFFLREFDRDSDVKTFAYATFIGHGGILRDSSGIQIIPVPQDMQIFKKNVSICGFPSPSGIRSAQPPNRYIEDLMANGIGGCYPKKEDIHKFAKHKSAARNSRYGYVSAEQAAEDTCNILSDKRGYVNKIYTPTGRITSSFREKHGIYKFNVVFITREDNGDKEGVITVNSPTTGEPLYYKQIGPFDLFNVDNLRELFGHIERKTDYIKTAYLDFLRKEQETASESEMQEMQSYLDGMFTQMDFATASLHRLFELTKPSITTNDIFNIFFLLKVNIAYILDTSCTSNTIPGTKTNAYLELPEGVGHGKRKTKTKRKKMTSKKRKRSYLK